MIRGFTTLSLLLLLCAPGCTPIAELEEENTQLRSRIDTLEVLRESCNSRLATLTQRITMLEQERALLEEQNKNLGERLSTSTGLGIVTVEPVTEIKATEVHAASPSKTPAKAAETVATQGEPRKAISKSARRQKSAGENHATAEDPASGADERGIAHEARAGKLLAELESAQNANMAAENTAEDTVRSLTPISETMVPPVRAEDVAYRQLAVPSSDAAEEAFLARYQDALSLYHKRRYQASQDKFSSLLATDVANDMVDNCMYWKGECLSALGRYADAAVQYSSVIAYRGSDKREAALMMRASAYMRLGKTEQAKQDYRRVVELFPNGEYRKQAQQKLRALRGR